MSQLPINQNNVCKTTKKERRKKLSVFKDRMHNMWGNKKVSGFGDGKPNICDICHGRVYRTKTVWDNTLQKLVCRCERCS